MMPERDNERLSLSEAVEIALDTLYFNDFFLIFIIGYKLSLLFSCTNRSLPSVNCLCKDVSEFYLYRSGYLRSGVLRMS